MKVSANAKRVGLAAVAAVLCATGAIAGSRYGQPSVTIFKNADGSGQVYGTLGGTRNSAFPVENLKCSVSRQVVYSSTGAELLKVVRVNCDATDRNGVKASCTSGNEKYADALNGLSNDGLIDFSFGPTGACTALTVYESSSLERKR
jgi:hypothetical protein